MNSPLTIADVGLRLLEPAEAVVSELTQSPHATWQLLRVAAGASWEAPAADLEERCLVVLEGMATFTVDGWRQSLGSGHLLVAEPGAKLTIRNDGADTLAALLCVTPSPVPAPVPV